MPPLADALLLDHHQRILEEDFPKLGDTQEVRAQHNLIADRLGKLVQENCSAREQGRAEKEHEKTKDPKELLGDVGVQ